MKIKHSHVILVLLILLTNNSLGQDVDRFIDKNTRVVLLGDPTHGEGNVFEYRTQLIKELVENHGFNTVGFESGTYFLNSDLLPPNSSIRKTLRGNVFSIYTATQQFQGTIDYIADKKLNFFGFDLQYSSEINEIEQAIDERIFSCLTTSQKDSLSLILDAIQTGSGYTVAQYSTLKNIIDEILVSCLNIENEVIITQLHYLNNMKELLRWSLKIDIENLMEEKWEASFTNIRDSMMAANVFRYLKKHPNRKLILIGANGHFASDLDSLKLESTDRYIPMGQILKDSLKSQLTRFGSIALGGAYGSLKMLDQIIRTPRDSYEWQLVEKMKGDSIQIISGSGLPNNCCLSTTMDYNMVCGNWTEVFDNYIVFSNYEPVDEVDESIIIKDTLLPFTEKELLSTLNLNLNHVVIDPVNIVAPRRKSAQQRFRKVIEDKIANNATVKSEQNFRFQSVGFKNGVDEFKMNGTLKAIYPSGYLNQEAQEQMLVENYTKVPKRYYNNNSFIIYDYRMHEIYNESVDSSMKRYPEIAKPNDLLKSAPIFQNPRKLKRYYFYLGEGTEDTLIINFRAKNANYKSTGIFYLKSYTGRVKVLRKHNAVVEVTLKAERDAEAIKKVGKKTFNSIGFGYKYAVSSEIFVKKSEYTWDKVDCIYKFVKGESKCLSEGKMYTKPNEKVKFESSVVLEEVR